jgi:hypothetical protein
MQESKRDYLSHKDYLRKAANKDHAINSYFCALSTYSLQNPYV